MVKKNAAPSFTLSGVKQWIGSIEGATLNEVISALQERVDALHEARIERATEGRRVVIQDVRPLYLNGLEGDIYERDEDGTVSILLTPASTGRLRFRRQCRYKVGADVRFLLGGVPASCCYSPDEGSDAATA